MTACTKPSGMTNSIATGVVVGVGALTVDDDGAASACAICTDDATSVLAFALWNFLPWFRTVGTVGAAGAAAVPDTLGCGAVVS